LVFKFWSFLCILDINPVLMNSLKRFSPILGVIL
jgi:hypothetical protein